MPRAPSPPVPREQRRRLRPRQRGSCKARDRVSARRYDAATEIVFATTLVALCSATPRRTAPRQTCQGMLLPLMNSPPPVLRSCRPPTAPTDLPEARADDKTQASWPVHEPKRATQRVRGRSSDSDAGAGREQELRFAAHAKLHGIAERDDRTTRRERRLASEAAEVRRIG